MITKIPADQFVQDAKRLRHEIHVPYDLIIAISRGGLIASQVLAYHKDVEIIAYPTRHVSEEFLDYVRKRAEGRSVLVVDGICATSKTLIEVSGNLDARPSALYTAVVYNFVRDNDMLSPDFVAYEMALSNEEQWLEFPWET